jgi:1-acyl-sn-glycerol-3-phosphate acyltransferase
MPLEPLTARGGLVAKLRALLLLAVGFVTLVLFNFLQMASVLLLPFSRAAVRRANRWLADTWWGWCVSAAERLYGVEILITGDDVPMRENAILVVNHQQMPDIPTLMKFARTKDRLGDMKYFIKKEFKWLPGMGWGLQMLDALFVQRNWSSDRERIHRTFARLVESRVPLYLVSFVEGTRLTAAKLAAAQDYARTNGLHVPRHTLVPRTKGFVASVLGLGTHLDAVYDLTIGYEDGVPSLWQYLQGLVHRIHLHVRRIPASELPEPPDELRQWLLARWEEKDELLESFYKTGRFPATTDP